MFYEKRDRILKSLNFPIFISLNFGLFTTKEMLGGKTMVIFYDSLFFLSFGMSFTLE